MLNKHVITADQYGHAFTTDIIGEQEPYSLTGQTVSPQDNDKEGMHPTKGFEHVEKLVME